MRTPGGSAELGAPGMQRPASCLACAQLHARLCHDVYAPGSSPLHSAAIEKLRGQNARLKEELLLENKFSV